MEALLRPAEKQTAYLKAGLLGFAGTGKTFTASLLAIGLAKLADKKTVAFFDTETGSDYVVDRFKREGVDLVVAKTRAFSDLLQVVSEAEQNASVLIIDSISHVWQELIETYQRKHKKARLSVWDWNPIKSEWRQFTDRYLCSRLHIVLCGRAGFTYDEYFNEQGDKEIIKTGTKMKVETDMGYEPSLLIEIERVMLETDPRKKRGSQWVHRATVLKDRTDLMNGKQIDNPTFEDFSPVIMSLNLGGEHFVLDPTRTSDAMLKGPDFSWEDKKRLQTVYSEEVEGALISAFPGMSAAEKKMKADILDVVFESRSWTKIKDMHPEKLRLGVEAVKYLCEQVKAAGELPEHLIPWLRGELIKMTSGNAEDNIPEFKSTDDEKYEGQGEFEGAK